MRPIDADALIKYMDENEIELRDDPFDGCFDGLKEVIKRFPTIDAVPVVRCEKCAHHSDILLKGMEDFVWCNFFNLYRCKDSFCSCGWVE